MQIRYTRMLLAMTAAAVSFGIANTAAAAQDPLARAVCCKIDGTKQLMPFARDCRKRNGQIVRIEQCRPGLAQSRSRARANMSTRGAKGRPPARTSAPQPRSHTSTHGASGRPPARDSGPQPRSGASTHGASGKPPASNQRGYPQTKPNGSLAGCKPRLTVTRDAALTKAGAILTAWIVWENVSTTTYGDEFLAAYSRERVGSCSKAGIIWKCTISAVPCPPK